MREGIEAGLVFIARCALADVPAEALAREFLRTIRGAGFHAAACGAWVGVGKNRRSRFFFVDWPADWLAFYQGGAFFEHDLLPLEARRRITPFMWSEACARYKLTPKQQQLCDAGIAYGWTDVLAVPIHGPGSLQGLVTMASLDRLGLDAVETAVLQAMAVAIWERCRTSAAFGVYAPEAAELTPREIECLQWAAAGKSDWDIAKLVGIKPATVHFHIESAKRRLGVRSRTEAVAIGVLNGVI
jgi:DNA-binding CsgD family transcriptional regulator